MLILDYENNVVEFLLPIEEDSQLSGDLYETEVRKAADLLIEHIGGLHGPNALRLFGTRIAKHALFFGDAVATIRVEAKVPSGMKQNEFLEYVERYWHKTHLSTGEFYVI